MIFRGRRKKCVEVPLFPGYLFCRYDADIRHRILDVPGVVSILGHGRNPEPVANDEIASLRTLERSGRELSPCAFLSQGQQVTISSGGLRGLQGLYVRHKNVGTVIVSVQLLMRSVMVELLAEDVITFGGRRQDA